MTNLIKWKGKLFRHIGMNYECPICNRAAFELHDYVPNGEYLGSKDAGQAGPDGGIDWIEFYKCKNCGKRYCFLNSNW